MALIFRLVFLAAVLLVPLLAAVPVVVADDLDWETDSIASSGDSVMAVSAFDEDHISVCARRADSPRELSVHSISEGGSWNREVIASGDSSTDHKDDRCDVARVNETVVYVAVRAKNLGLNNIWFFNSTDGGETWGSPVEVDRIRAEDEGNGLTFPNTVAIDSGDDGSTIMVAAQRPIIAASQVDMEMRNCISEDSGGNWTCRTVHTVTDVSGSGNAVMKCMDAKIVDEPNDVYVTVYQVKDRTLIAHSTDGGSSWTSSVVLLHPYDGSRLRCEYNAQISLVPGSTDAWFVLADRQPDPDDWSDVGRICRTTDQGDTYSCFWFTSNNWADRNKGLAAQSNDVAWIAWYYDGPSGEIQRLTQIEVDGLEASIKHTEHPVPTGSGSGVSSGIGGYALTYVASSNTLVLGGQEWVAVAESPLELGSGSVVEEGDETPAAEFDSGLVGAADAMGFEGTGGKLAFGVLLLTVLLFAVGWGITSIFGKRWGALSATSIAALTAFINFFSDLWGLDFTVLVLILIFALTTGMEFRSKLSDVKGESS